MSNDRHNDCRPTVEDILGRIDDPDLRTWIAEFRSASIQQFIDAAATVEHTTEPRPLTSLTLTPPKPTSRIRSRIARMMGRWEVRLDNRPLVKALFDETYYLNQHRITLKPGQRALDHYLTQGLSQGLSPHPLIDTDWYGLNRSNEAPPRFDLIAYLTSPERFRDPVHPLFDADLYLNKNPDVEAACVNPLAHYIIFGWREQREPNVLFQSAWYWCEHTDVLAGGLSPLAHYVRYGAADGRQPHPLFDRAYYLKENPDVGASSMDDYVHYITSGRFDGRFPHAKIEAIAHRTGLDAQSVVEALVPVGREAPPAMLGAWPPSPIDGYALPETLRRLIGQEFKASQVPLYRYLMSVISKYADRPEGFPESQECAGLIDRIAGLAKGSAAGGDVEISVIIPAYNNLLYTLTAIVSVLEAGGSRPFEIIVADDSSTDTTPDVIGKFNGSIRLQRSSSNLGFLRNCNAAAETASGGVLVFLNNDVLVLPGWLDALVQPLENSSVGMAGARLLQSDGSLQEAGGIFWNNGSASNFGRGADATAPEYAYFKDVDYVSGASIAIRTDLWRQLGGFDPLFSPAYCEDADLAFRLRQRGLRTVYQPLATVIHHEGRSHGRDLTSGVKASQVTNQAKFVERWKDVLAREHFPSGEDAFLARDRSRDKPHILIIDHYIPQWDRDAGSRTLYLYIRMFLEQGFSITFWPDNQRNDREYGDQLRQMGVEIITSLSGSRKFADWVRDHGRYLQYALVCRPHVAEKYIDDIRKFSDATLLYYGVDLHYKRLEAASLLHDSPALKLDAERWKDIERNICVRCDVVMYPGCDEVEIIRGWTPKAVSVIDFPITIFSAREIADARQVLARHGAGSPYDMMFVGGFAHAPNVGGVIWFVSQVLPLLREADPRFRLRIVGSKAPPAVMALAGPGVEFLGRVSDDELNALYLTSGLAVVPLLFGAGVKGKVIEAMGKGVPVVMTSTGAQGLPNAEDFAFVVDGAEAMADVILRIAAAPADAAARASLALDFLEARFSTDAVRRLLTPFMPELRGTAVEGSKLRDLPGHSL